MKQIYDWNYQKSSDRESSIILINYHSPEKNIEQAVIRLQDIDIDKIDFLLLMTHFKGKYGQLTSPK